jgi:membrane protein YqaA with SNARE-associated domain
MSTQNKTRGLIAVILSVILVAVLALFLAEQIVSSPALQSFVAQLGYLGVILVAIIGGLNIIVPIPAVTLTPIFTASGLHLPFIILSLTIGTLIADYIGYAFGHFSRPVLYAQYPKVVSWLEEKITTKPTLLFPITFLFAAFLPVPNEVLVIPLAILGIKFRRMILPLLLGNLVNQTIYATGIQAVFSWWF